MLIHLDTDTALLQPKYCGAGLIPKS